jgi:hypothetical protein
MYRALALLERAGERGLDCHEFAKRYGGKDEPGERKAAGILLCGLEYRGFAVARGGKGLHSRRSRRAPRRYWVTAAGQGFMDAFRQGAGEPTSAKAEVPAAPDPFEEDAEIDSLGMMPWGPGPEPEDWGDSGPGGPP